ncbi:MAG: fructosamine kinase family protein [Bacteroidota bacterium]
MDWSNSDQQSFFENVLLTAFGKNLAVQGYHFLSGGCINNAVRLDTTEGQYFLKWNQINMADMFERESEGLKCLACAESIQVPKPISFGSYQDYSYLLLEYLPEHRRSTAYWQKLGEGLAQLHAHTQSSFGFEHDNYIGRLEQKNMFTDSWIDFFVEHRLEVQLGLALYNGCVDDAFMSRFRRLYPKLPELLPEEKPALLHGDLWSGNVMPGHHGEPAIFDPAVYFGHREIELAFTQLFGGFDQEFYLSYNDTFPLIPGFDERVDIYNLYPLLVHVNLFGTSYLSGIERTLRKYL